MAGSQAVLSRKTIGDVKVPQTPDLKLSVAEAKLKGKGQRAKGKGQNEGLIGVYPNPAKDVLNVEFVTGDDGSNTAAVGTCRGMSMQMFTMQGILVFTQNVSDVKPGLNKITLDLQDLPNGAYMLKVNCGGNIETRKVIVNR